jgi:hypothetical protein
VHRLITSASRGFKTSEACRLLHISGYDLPLHDLNWSNFAPVKVKVFLCIGARELICRLGILRSPDMSSVKTCATCSCRACASLRAICIQDLITTFSDTATPSAHDGRLVFDAVRTGSSAFFSIVRQHLAPWLWVVAVLTFCHPLSAWGASQTSAPLFLCGSAQTFNVCVVLLILMKIQVGFPPFLASLKKK